ncbi:MAG: hypothetical protein ACI4CX_01855 [Candidatus Weimeria sp.]
MTEAERSTRIKEIMKQIKKVKGSEFNHTDTWHWEAKIDGHSVNGNPMYTKREIAEGILKDQEEEWY